MSVYPTSHFSSCFDEMVLCRFGYLCIPNISSLILFCSRHFFHGKFQVCDGNGMFNAIAQAGAFVPLIIIIPHYSYCTGRVKRIFEEWFSGNKFPLVTSVMLSLNCFVLCTGFEGSLLVSIVVPGTLALMVTGSKSFPLHKGRVTQVLFFTGSEFVSYLSHVFAC